MPTLNEQEMLKRDIEALNKRIKLEYEKSASKILTPQEMAALSEQVRELQAELDQLRNRLDNAEN